MTVFSKQNLSAPLHILLIEDDEGDRELALEYLKADRQNLYQVTWAESLEAGLALLEQTHFDAIILDLVLPDSRGVTTVSKLCARSGGIPVIVSSYFDENALASKVIELGAQDYLAKDHMDSQTLGRTMSRALARAKHQTAQLSRQPATRQNSDMLSQKVQQLQSDIRRLETVAKDINQTTDKQVLDDVRQRMVTTLSHECRTPATIILLATNILKSYDQNIADEKYIATVSRIDDAVRQMMQLIDNARVFKQVQSLMTMVSPEYFDMQALGENVIAKIASSVDPSPCIKATYVGVGSSVYGYEEIVKHVLLQLLTNAAQYSALPTTPVTSRDERPRDRIASFPIILTMENNPEALTLQVKDQGCGIPEAELSRVCEAFYRISYVDNIHGIGLGLTIVKTCVDMCGGQLEIDSDVGKGTTVTVTLPKP
ncbi:MAG: hybrid sensor histidine kinase/response regulator [Cyanobacteria bacterium P01_A01_bin.116]